VLREEAFAALRTFCFSSDCLLILWFKDYSNSTQNRCSMISNRMCPAFVLAAAFTTLAVIPPASADPFDGNWNVVVQTTNGHCGITQWGVVIRDGRVSSPGSTLGGYPGRLAGDVSPSGQVRVGGLAGPRSASGAGRIALAAGSGTWSGRGPSGTCAGVWRATRY
jgi:hypothetical protein